MTGMRKVPTGNVCPSLYFLLIQWVHPTETLVSVYAESLEMA